MIRKRILIALLMQVILILNGCSSANLDQAASSSNYKEYLNRENIDQYALCFLCNYKDQKITTSENEWEANLFSKDKLSVRNYFIENSNGKLDIKPFDIGCKEKGITSIDIDCYYSEDSWSSYPKAISKANEEIKEILESKDYEYKNNFEKSKDLVVFIVIPDYQLNNPKELNSDGSIYGLDTVARTNEKNRFQTIIIGEKAFTEKKYRNETLPKDTDESKFEVFQFGDDVYYISKEESIEQIAALGSVCELVAEYFGLALLCTEISTNPNLIITNGAGYFSLMGMGDIAVVDENKPIGYMPNNLDPYSKSLLGFVELQEVKADGEYKLYSQSTGKYNAIKIATGKDGEIFILENRQMNGYDASFNAEYLKSGGIAIWHLNEKEYEKAYKEYKFNDYAWNYPAVPNINEKYIVDRKNKKGVDIVEANEKELGYELLDKEVGFPFKNQDILFHQGGTSVFGPDTIPNTNTFDGIGTGIKIEVVSTSSDVMSVKISFENKTTTPN